MLQFNIDPTLYNFNDVELGWESRHSINNINYCEYILEKNLIVNTDRFYLSYNFDRFNK